MRNTIDITIPTEGRDKGKTFRITEMSAKAGEKWALRVVNGVARAGFELPEELRGIGMAAVATLGVKTIFGMAWSDLEPLLDELLACVQIVMPKGVRPLVDEDIEEPKTLLMLRAEVLELHTSFFSRAGLSNLIWSAGPAPESTASPKSPTSPA